MNYIDAAAMRRAFLAGAEELKERQEWINELNVFPVPDGDTGTNMAMTMLSAAAEVEAAGEPSMELLAKAVSSGSLRGARGNSGVILSQLLRGFTREIAGSETVDTKCLARAFARGTETAYKAVMKPKEGTILTVARGMAEKAAEASEETEDVIVFLERVIEHGDYVLSQTPELLPVLKQAGVVDSGGQGLMQVVKGCLRGLKGELSGSGAAERAKPGSVRGEAPALRRFSETDGGMKREAGEAGKALAGEIRFGYCTEFIINLEPELSAAFDGGREQELREYLESIGDSLVLVADAGLVKVHVHTNDPGLAIQKALAYGSLSKIKIDNMREEHEERLIKGVHRTTGEQAGAHREAKREQKESGSSFPAAQGKPAGFVAVAAGAGFSEIFKGIGADAVIEGGQTMNPSTEDILRAVEECCADTVYVLPNNRNILLAAEQAGKLSEGCRVIVVPSLTVPQGITALVNFAPDLPPEENLRIMEQEMGRVKTGQITYAVRSASMDGREIREGDILGLGDNGVLATGSSVTQTALAALEAMADEDAELITIYYGDCVKTEDAQAFLEAARERFPDCEAELHYGGQPVYYYLLSVE